MGKVGIFCGIPLDTRAAKYGVVFSTPVCCAVSVIADDMLWYVGRRFGVVGAGGAWYSG